MTSKQVSLGVAEFCDSSFARVAGVSDAELRKIAEDLFELCYARLGKEPRFLDGEDVRVLVAQLLPGRFARKDPRVVSARPVIEAFVEHVAASCVMTNAFEVRQALPAACAQLEAAVRAGANVPEAPAPSDPFVHGASKVGRNDPCSCGSGKKFKKCHGKDA